MGLRNYILSYDTYCAVVVAIFMLLALPAQVSVDFAKDIFAVGISVLSIIFGIFFAALAFIISATDNEFVKLLEEKKYFTSLIKSFEVTLGSLFIAMIFAIFFYAYTSLKASNGEKLLGKLWIIFFFFLFSYSLVATLLATRDAIRFSKYRIKFMDILSKDKKKD